MTALDLFGKYHNRKARPRDRNRIFMHIKAKRK
jgi:hypothetical protein